MRVWGCLKGEEALLGGARGLLVGGVVLLAQELGCVIAQRREVRKMGFGFRCLNCCQV